jgi:hypothetical protein
MSYPFREPSPLDGAAAAQRAIGVLEKQSAPTSWPAW